MGQAKNRGTAEERVQQARAMRRENPESVDSNVSNKQECIYEERFIAFIDILGFGKLVEDSEAAIDLPRKILDALTSMHPTKIQNELFATVNVEIVPEKELARVKELAIKMAEAQNKLNPVRISYFSDSLVISAKADDVIASQMVLDLLTKISAMMWMLYKIVLRGGVTVGKLVHLEGGPMFGPAMNRAYDLESRLAIYPRFLIDGHCIDQYRKVESFRLFESLIQKDGDFYYASLATAFKHIINDSSIALSGEKVLRKFREALCEAPRELQRISEIHKVNQRIKEKYEWLAKDFAERTPEVFTASGRR